MMLAHAVEYPVLLEILGGLDIFPMFLEPLWCLACLEPVAEVCVCSVSPKLRRVWAQIRLEAQWLKFQRLFA